MPMKPSSPIFFTTSEGNLPSASRAAAPGATSERAKSRAASRIIFCWSLSSNISAALEVGSPFLEEGGHSFLLVVRREEPGEVLRLEGERVAEVHVGAAAHQLFRGADGDG